MILTDREIRIAVDNDLISIKPPPSEVAYSSTSVDLTLDETLTLFNQLSSGMETVIDPALPGYNHEEVLTKLTKRETIEEAGYVLKPSDLILAWTAETVNLKHSARLAARVEGKSSLARLGLAVHITAPTIHAGFSGRIRLEMINHGKIPIRLRKGMPICQLIIEQTLGTPDKGYNGRFAGQTTAKIG